MSTSIVLTIIGDDCPGIIETLSATLAKHHGNWAQSSMSTLAGQFAGIMLATVPDEHVGEALAALGALKAEGLTVITHATKESHDPEPTHNFSLEVVGNDDRGIVRDITGVLKSHQVNVEDLESGVEAASMAGGNLFRARARLQVPDTTDLDALQADIENIAGDLMVDIQQES